MYKHIVMPIDGSELSKAAVRQGVQLAKENGAKVTFLNVGAPFHVVAANAAALTDTPSDYEKHSRQRAQRILRECETAARNAGVTSEGVFAVNEHPY